MTHSENSYHPETTVRVAYSPSLPCHSRAGANDGVHEDGAGVSLPARTAAAYQHWTPPRIRYFLSRLADTGNVMGVCREMDLSRQSVYALRARDEAFARAWQGAMLRHRDALVDLCLERATVGVTEEIVVDGRLAERTRPDGAMLRHMLNRADRLCDDGWPSARPAKQSERHFEALLDCLDPPADRNGEDCADAPPDREALLADIAASAQWDWKEDWRANTDPAPELGPGVRVGRVEGPCGYASDEEAADALIAYKRIMATPPEEVDISDLDPAGADDWTDEQWLRADRSGLTDTMFADEGASRAEGEEEGGEEGGDPESRPEREDAAGEEDP
jgi:hypothetical protein